MKMEALDVLKNRRSIRKFKQEQVKDEELALVLEAGTYAPTASGTQGCKIVVVQEEESLAAVRKLNAKVLGRPSADPDPYYGAPTILIVFATPESHAPHRDGAAVMTNLLNAAYAVGLASCWIDRPIQMFEMPEGKALLKKWGLSEDLQGVASIALGYADMPDPQPKERKADYITWIK
ncbi:MAG: nitroreductase family protein [Clostridia bacterium]|nr:nitroreductase family protein [Clostridia bacterium]MBR3196513.1 nitroreductase family protein [Clostridia bacterium]